MELSSYDLKCKEIQAKVYAAVHGGRQPNSFEPWKQPGKTVLESGEVCLNDLCYSSSCPNSFFDIWYPDEQKRTRPTVIYFHGGGFIFGDKSNGDPLSVSKGTTAKLLEIVKAGYNLVNANYALAPEYRFPYQLNQVDLLIRYLQEHADELGLDMKHVCLSGSSAGADLTEIYGAAVSNADYAMKLGLEPCITPNELRVLAIDEAALDCRSFDEALYTLLLCWLGGTEREYSGKLASLDAKAHIQNTYIPSWINTSNRGIYFIREAIDLAEKLKEIDVDHDVVYFPADAADLDHGYMDLYATNTYAREALDRMLAFIKKQLSD